MIVKLQLSTFISLNILLKSFKVIQIQNPWLSTKKTLENKWKNAIEAEIASLSFFTNSFPSHELLLAFAPW